MSILVPAAARALAVFEVFAKEKRELSNTELAKLLNLAESSCSDLVSTLVHCGYVTRIGGSRRIYPTGKLIQVAGAIRAEDVESKRLRAGAQELRDQTGESVLCGKIESGVVRVIVFCEGRFELRYNTTVSQKIPLHTSALGKAILAMESKNYILDQLQQKPLRRLASGTLTSMEALLKQIQAFRKQGYSRVENESGEDIAAIGVAGKLGSTTFGISIVGPVGRVRLNLNSYLPALRSTAVDIFDEADTRV